MLQSIAVVVLKKRVAGPCNYLVLLTLLSMGVIKTGLFHVFIFLVGKKEVEADHPHILFPPKHIVP